MCYLCWVYPLPLVPMLSPVLLSSRIVSLVPLSLSLHSVAEGLQQNLILELCLLPAALIRHCLCLESGAVRLEPGGAERCEAAPACSPFAFPIAAVH